MANPSLSPTAQFLYRAYHIVASPVETNVVFHCLPGPRPCFLFAVGEHPSAVDLCRGPGGGREKAEKDGKKNEKEIT